MAIKDVLKKVKNEEDYYVVCPAVSIEERSDSIVLYAEMPGVNKENISVELIGDELLVEGKRVSDTPKDVSVIHQERYPIMYKRAFTLGSDMNRSKINAEFKNGVLTVELQKDESTQPRKISIA